MDGGAFNRPAQAALANFGCYARVPPFCFHRRSELSAIPAEAASRPKLQKTGRVLVKDEKFKERLTAQFRAEFFNVLNHPNFYNPTGPRAQVSMILRARFCN